MKSFTLNFTMLECCYEAIHNIFTMLECCYEVIYIKFYYVRMLLCSHSQYIYYVRMLLFRHLLIFTIFRGEDLRENGCGRNYIKYSAN